MFSIATNNMNQANSLINNGANANLIYNGTTPLFLSIGMGNMEAANSLIRHGADVNLKVNGETPLQFAAVIKKFNFVKLLIDHGATIGNPDSYASPKMAAFIRAEYARVHPGNSNVSVTSAKAGVQAVNEGLGSGGNRENRDSPQGTVPISAPISVNTPDYRGREHPDDFAVVVGVEKYAQDLPAAEFADEDAKAFRAHLLALGVPARHIVYLADERAGRSELVKNIERWLPKNVKPDSRVYFYFSGHGAPDPSTGDAYLLPFSGDPADLSDTAYPLSRLYANLGKLKARHVIVALDSCFSGAGGRSVIASGTRPLVNRVKEGVIPQNGKLIVLTASKSDQTSGVLKDKKHGTFTYYLLKGLNGKALDSKNRVTIDSLYSYLAPKVEDAAHLDDRDQDPQLEPKAAQSSTDLVLR